MLSSGMILSRYPGRSLSPQSCFELENYAGMRLLVFAFYYKTRTIALFLYFKLFLYVSQERELELQKEQRRQEENDKLRQEFAQHANAFHQWIQETRYSLLSLDLPLENSSADICIHPISLRSV